MGILSNLSIGVIAGLTATLITGFAYNIFWLKCIQPWYEERIYHDAIIKGTWEIEMKINEEIRTGVMELHQKGHHIHGTVTTTPKNEQFSIEGSFRNLIVTATYDTKNKSLVARGSLTLMLKNNGNNLNGYLSFYSFEKNEICPTIYNCVRKLV